MRLSTIVPPVSAGLLPSNVMQPFSVIEADDVAPPTCRIAAASDRDDVDLFLSKITSVKVVTPLLYALSARATAAETEPTLSLNFEFEKSALPIFSITLPRFKFFAWIFVPVSVPKFMYSIFSLCKLSKISVASFAM